MRVKIATFKGKCGINSMKALASAALIYVVPFTKLRDVCAVFLKVVILKGMKE